MNPEATRLFTPLIKDMRATKTKYEGIQQQLVEVLLHEMVRKVVMEITDTAKFTINILKRNLFERTADVGYLATDVEIVHFLRLSGNEADQEQIDRQAAIIKKRLLDYQYEYTVYNDILIIDLDGHVRANFDENNPVSFSNDPLLAETQAIGTRNHSGEDKFIETFRATDLRPGLGDVLMYSQKIEDPETLKSLGTLCLCFDFADEMQKIFSDLVKGDENIIAGVLDRNGSVIASSQPSILSSGMKIQVNLEAEFSFHAINGMQYLARTVATDGYQGFYGLTWYGVAMIEVGKAFSGAGKEGCNPPVIARLQNMSHELTAVKRSSDELLDDMKIDGINGKIQAQVFSAKPFVEVLEFIDNIGLEIDRLCLTVIENLQRIVVTSRFNEVQFRAFQGNNIADRNLYERANDVCWWALNPLFRRLLAGHLNSGIRDEERRQLTESLQYINNLYTPYLRLVLADPDGIVLAVSNPPNEVEERFIEDALPREQEFVGMRLENTLVSQAIKLGSKKDYCVSAFEPTILYGNRPTYIYSTAVRAPDNEGKVVGVIQIVFDSEPQFQDMLEGILPKDANGQSREGCFALFVDKERNIIASTSTSYPAGSQLDLDSRYFSMNNGERRSSIVEIGSISYIVGLQCSNGYREYKRTDRYKNDVLCIIFLPTDS
ncbi:cache domain-containing protein [Desulfobulbus alkaliphilus]|uniref:cache domain-containing protein n=1 Tax=Desulfobulbus alkaliphilus TaxID=869814 RepID=UPI001966CA03|nr:cache domain-containing protein [Desulfobulbus alkaliphilus]MBM9536687.1 cache domain-containing protein [Desulfobulbus alkaliphilus]